MLFNNIFKMDEQLCIQCRELIGHRRSYSWVSREEHYSDITQFIIGDLINRQVSLHKYPFKYDPSNSQLHEQFINS